MFSLRTLLVLGRTSNLPTVWSNCLAGWWLGGHENTGNLVPLLGGATMLYVGGMFLNDAFDANFDAIHRRERPIPSGAISVGTVWQIGLGLLAAGMICLSLLGLVTALIAVLLVACILAYDAVHKVITLSPILMAGCRFFLYLAAASAAADGLQGFAVWSAFALAAYIVGLSYVARKETGHGALDYWPCALLLVPILMAGILNTGEYLKNAMLLSLLLGLWIARSLRYAYRAADRNVGRTVSSLLAGVVWVDLLAVADVPKSLAMIFIGFFLLSLFFQKFIPAT